MKKYYIATYGCQMNYSDTERLKTLLESYDFKESKKRESADFIIFNSCSVRQKAEDRVYGEMVNMAELKKKKKDLLIGLTGCMVRKGKEHKIEGAINQLDIAFRPEDMGELDKRIKKLRPKWKIQGDDIDGYFAIAPKTTNKYQVFVPIMTGCDKFCTYCVVPYSRGREKSRSFGEVLAECKKLVEAGAKEITLLGQTVNSYGLSFEDTKSGIFEKYKDKKLTPFAKLLIEINKLHKKGLRNLRFTSSHPKDFTGGLIKTLAKLKTICPYIHLPVQSGSNSCLRRMNRPYTREKYIEIIKKIRKAIPDCAISTDIIVGFCGETEEEFLDTCALYEEIGFDMAYLAKYSPRKGTFAEKKLKDDVPRKIKVERWHRLNEILKKWCLKRNEQLIGKTVEVLIEKQTAKELIGRSREYKEVHVCEFGKKKKWIGKIVKVKIENVREWELYGDLRMRL